jgi:microcystin-dependent protein
LFCDGTQVLKSDYPQSYAVIANTYGTASNSDYFVLPNLSEKIPMGNSNSGQTGFLLGNSGGNKNITLGVNQLPSHSHTGTTSSAGTHSHSATDSGHQHRYQDAYFADFRGGGQNVIGNDFFADNDNEYIYRTPAPSTERGYASITIGNNGAHTHTFTTSTTGSGDSVNVLNPYLILNYIIKT